MSDYGLTRLALFTQADLPARDCEDTEGVPHWTDATVVEWQQRFFAAWHTVEAARDPGAHQGQPTSDGERLDAEGGLGIPGLD